MLALNMPTRQTNFCFQAVRISTCNNPGIWITLLGAGLFHHFRPLGLLPVDILGVILRKSGRRLGTVGGDARLHEVRGQRILQCAVELLDDLWRRAGRTQQAIGLLRLKARQSGFVDGHQVRQDRRALVMGS